MIALGRIAEIARGRILGDRDFQISTISSLANATADSLCYFADPKQESYLKATAAGAVMLRSEHAGLFNGNRIIVSDPKLAYARISILFKPQSVGAWDDIHPVAIIAKTAVVSDGALVGPYSIIGDRTVVSQGVIIGGNVCIGEDCKIGRGTVIDNGVIIYPRTTVGENCNLSSGVVLGASGFGYAEDNGEWVRIEQVGGVTIGDDVDIGANTTIDRGALDDTVIGNGVKLDNQIQIAHNVRVGDHTIMAGCVAIAGSAVIGKRCRLGGRASVLGHLEIADDVTVNANSFVASSISEKGVYSSMIPARPAPRWRRTVAQLNRLDALASKIKAVSKKKENE